MYIENFIETALDVLINKDLFYFNIVITAKLYLSIHLLL